MTVPNSVANNCPEQKRGDLIARIDALLDEMAEMNKTNTKLENHKNMALVELSQVLKDNLDLKKCNQSLLKKVAEMEASNKSASAPTQSPDPRPSDQLRSIWRPKHRPTKDVPANNADVSCQQENQKLKEENSRLTAEAANAKQEVRKFKLENNALSAQLDKTSDALREERKEKKNLARHLDKATDQVLQEHQRVEMLRADAAAGKHATEFSEKCIVRINHLKVEVGAANYVVKKVQGEKQELSKELCTVTRMVKKYQRYTGGLARDLDRQTILANTTAEDLAYQRLLSSLLKTGIVNARHDNAGLHATISELRGKLAMQENAVQENAGLRQTIFELQGRLGVHENAVQENFGLHKTVSQLWRQLGVERTENYRLNMTVKHKEGRYGELMSSFNSLRDERDSAIRDNVAAEKKAKDADAAVAAIREFYEQRESSNPRTDMLENSEVQAGRIDVLERALATANQAVEQKDDNLGVFESKLARTKRRLKDSNDRQKDLRTKISELEEELSTANSTVERLAARVELDEKNARQFRSDFSELSSILSRVQDAKEAAELKVRQQDQQISQYIAASC